MPAGIVDRADAVVFVTPEYNYGYPAALKNAIDYLMTNAAGAMLDELVRLEAALRPLREKSRQAT